MLNNRPLIIGLSGQLGSGKSTLAESLAEALSGQKAAFGDYVRDLAKLSGASVERASLQKIGEAAVRRDPVAFVHAFLTWADPKLDCPFIIDGVRHIDIDKALRVWATGEGADYLAILVVASDHVRADRRTDGVLTTLTELDAHPVERESVTALPDVVDFKVAGDSGVEQAVAAISEWVSARK